MKIKLQCKVCRKIFNINKNQLESHNSICNTLCFYRYELVSAQIKDILENIRLKTLLEK